MIQLYPLRVSLTKNGYIKIAYVLERHTRWEVLDNIRGVYPGINLARSQAANIMGESLSGELPEFWDEIRAYSDRAIRSFVLVAIIFSHVDLINLLQSSSEGKMKGRLQRGKVGNKAFTNLVYAMASCDLCNYVRGAQIVEYDLRSLVSELGNCGHLVRQLIEFKLKICGWRAPGLPGGTDFFRTCNENHVPQVFGLGPMQFRQWLENNLSIDPPEQRAAQPRPK